MNINAINSNNEQLSYAPQDLREENKKLDRQLQDNFHYISMGDYYFNQLKGVQLKDDLQNKQPIKPNTKQDIIRQEAILDAYNMQKELAQVDEEKQKDLDFKKALEEFDTKEKPKFMEEIKGVKIDTLVAATNLYNNESYRIDNNNLIHLPPLIQQTFSS